ncbi:hypothetical protein HDV02_002178 [Globomyces sp. JEL0801]|nr:hypothetical protein HDV02_002178 [Globomyces sp. JEL0801]
MPHSTTVDPPDSNPDLSNENTLDPSPTDSDLSNVGLGIFAPESNDADFIGEDNIQSTSDVEELSIKDVQDAMNKSHPFGIKIWKPSLFPKHRSIDAKIYDALHSRPISYQSQFSLGNLFWVDCISLFFFGHTRALGTFILSFRSAEKNAKSVVARFFKDLSGLNAYINVYLNLAGYIFWPFGKFVAKRIAYDVIFQDSPTEVPLLQDESTQHLHYDAEMAGPSTQLIHSPALVNAVDSPLFFNSSFRHNEFQSLPEPAASVEGDLRSSFYETQHSGSEDFDNWSEYSATKKNVILPVWFSKVAHRVWNSGVSGIWVFLTTVLVLGPVHLLVSGVCYFIITPIPMGKLNYFLLRHILRHPLQLTAHSCTPVASIRTQTPSHNQNIEDEIPTPRPRTNAPRPRSVFFWSPDTAIINEETLPNIHAQVSTQLPSIIATPSFNTSRTYAAQPNTVQNREYQIVLCIHQATGFEYLKYTIGGVNIIFINLLSMILFTLADFYFIGPRLNYTGIGSKMVIFVSGLLSTIPLAYFIGMAVSSITAQTGSVAIGSVINATFGSIIEIILYAFGLMQGKEELVQGAMIGSFLLGLLALPGVSMFSGGLKRSEQRFNVKSAGVTSTMLVVAVIAVFTPTVFQNIHGTFQFDCESCPIDDPSNDAIDILKSCRSCRIYQPHPTEDPIYMKSTRPLMYICAVVLVLTYAIGLWFTLRTHAHRIYPSKKRHIRKQRNPQAPTTPKSPSPNPAEVLSANQPKQSDVKRRLSNRLNKSSIKKPATLNLRVIPPNSSPFSSSSPSSPNTNGHAKPKTSKRRSNMKTAHFDDSSSGSESEDEHGGHDNPGWGVAKSACILLGCTIAYAMIAEVLIDSLDEILEVFPMSEKTLGLTIFAIVPTVTEFYNAISFAMSGNIVLALEIGSAYAIQVALLQIPALVAFSALWTQFGSVPTIPDVLNKLTVSQMPMVETPMPGRYSYRLLEMIYNMSGLVEPVLSMTVDTVKKEPSQFTVFLCKFVAKLIFLVTYVYLEGKSNYFKGALLLLSYFVLTVTFFFEP